ncbi:1-acyl-sn-glycerol-3-phosphate acyltransferase [Olsenella sp. SW781]|uniref:lysophospholipid acyltransferase family protein n=1 Tax=Olsenella sp. SW781 TaxID=2530046 RepID=UPI00143A9CB2|nr:lysophospholipid acyltransferase family protein [Olsenella sp. SW781]NJE79862.1 1-acyl-sn-glycerol-3-phosphate acyltransferase [Olsenella sp. SW781]
MSEKNARGEKGGRMRAFAGNTFDDYYDHDLRDHPLPGRLLIGAVVRILWLVTKLLWPWRIERAERLLDDARGRVIIMNHESMLDPVVVVVTMWLARVPVRIVYKSEFDKLLPATWLFSRAGGFPVERGTADMKVVRRARAMLSRGECVLIYPEGTRVRDDAEQQSHGGYAIMAQLAKAPVQPVAIVGARHLRFRRPVYVRVGDPIEWSDLAAGKRKEQLAEMERVGMARVYELRDALREDHPGVE